jgi:hypothetical protein
MIEAVIEIGIETVGARSAAPLDLSLALDFQS